MIADKTLIVEEHVTLPIDAVGETIRPGARVMHDGRVWLVRTLMLTDDSEWLLDGEAEGGVLPSRTIRPMDCKVLEERTLEDVLSDFAADISSCCDDCETVQRYADEIRQILGVSS